jgi:preprotein translocase subunit Sec63
MEPIKEFIPHELLGVAENAPIPVVRKAYRKLSR